MTVSPSFGPKCLIFFLIPPLIALTSACSMEGDSPAEGARGDLEAPREDQRVEDARPSSIDQRVGTQRDLLVDRALLDAVMEDRGVIEDRGALEQGAPDAG